MRALHEAEGIEIAIYDGRLHHATPGVEDPGVPFRRVSQRGVAALAAAGGHRAVIATSAGRIALPAAYWGARRAGVPFLYWTGIWSQLTTPAHLAAIPLVRRIERARRRDHRLRPARRGIRPLARRHERPRRAAAGRRRLLVGRRRRAGRTRAGRRPAAARAVRRARRAGQGPPGAARGVAADAARGGRRRARAGRAARARARPARWRSGPLDPADLRNFFAAADVVVVPSVPTRSFREPWGLVVNEAMLQGTCVIATDAVGAAAGGLVSDGETGARRAGRRPGRAGRGDRRPGGRPGTPRRRSAPRARRPRAGTTSRPARQASRRLSRASARRGKPLLRAADDRLCPAMRLLASRDVYPPSPRLRARNLIACALLALAAWSALPAPPARADYRDLITDACGRDPATGVADERVSGTYSQKDYRDALRNLSDDQLQYTDCEAIIRAAQLAGARAEAGGGKSTPGRRADRGRRAAIRWRAPRRRSAPRSSRPSRHAESGGGTPLRVGGDARQPEQPRRRPHRRGHRERPPDAAAHRSDARGAGGDRRARLPDRFPCPHLPQALRSPPRRRTPRAAPAGRRARPDWLPGAALSIGLAAVLVATAMHAGGGLQLAPLTTVTTGLDVLAGRALHRRAARSRRRPSDRGASSPSACSPRSRR